MRTQIIQDFTSRFNARDLDRVYLFQLSNCLLTFGRFAFPAHALVSSGPHLSDYAHWLSAYQPSFPCALSLWSSLSARRVSHDTSHSFQTFSTTERIDESYIKALTATPNCRLTISEDAWAFLGDKADMPRVKIHKCAL